MKSHENLMTFQIHDFSWIYHGTSENIARERQFMKSHGSEKSWNVHEKSWIWKVMTFSWKVMNCYVGIMNRNLKANNRSRIFKNRFMKFTSNGQHIIRIMHKWYDWSLALLVDSAMGVASLTTQERQAYVCSNLHILFCDIVSKYSCACALRGLKSYRFLIRIYNVDANGSIHVCRAIWYVIIVILRVSI